MSYGAGKGHCAGQYRRLFPLSLFGSGYGSRRDSPLADLCIGGGPDPVENEGGVGIRHFVHTWYYL
jgi:hypothetical protein